MYIVNKKGLKSGDKYVIPCEFDKIEEALLDDKPTGNVFFTLKDDLYGIAIVKNEEECKVEYTLNEFESIDHFKNGIAIVTRYCERFGTKYGAVDINLDERLECIYEDIYWLSDKLLRIKKNGKYGIYSLTEKKIIVDCNFKSLSCFEKDGKEQVILEV